MLLSPAALVLAVGIVLVSLNAMRAGLLTRFMGALGIVAGVLQVIQYGSALPLVQTFWLGGLALLYAGPPPRRRPARLAHRPRGAVAVARSRPPRQRKAEQAEAERRGRPPEPAPRSRRARARGRAPGDLQAQAQAPQLNR